MQWYAVMCKARKEWLAVKNLNYQGYATFFPHHKAWTTPVRTKPRLVVKPYLTRYIFTAMTNRGKHSVYQINNTIGVSSVVYCGPGALTIPIEIIEELRSRGDERGEIPQDTAPVFPGRPGDLIKFAEHSPLFGLLAEIQRVDKDGSLMVKLDQMLGAERLVPVRSADVGAIVHRERSHGSPKRAYHV